MTEKKSSNRSRTHRLRTHALAGFWILQAAVLLGRSVQLQLLDDDVWRERARAQYATHIDLPAERGAILDRNGRSLVLAARQFRVYIAIREMADPDRSSDGRCRRRIADSLTMLYGKGSTSTRWLPASTRRESRAAFWETSMPRGMGDRAWRWRSTRF
jgi:cell division protein FtsI/penicillin-binding protein 2